MMKMHQAKENTDALTEAESDQFDNDSIDSDGSLKDSKDFRSEEMKMKDEEHGRNF